MKITPKDVERLAFVSRLELTDEEKTAYTKSLQESLSYLDLLKQADTTAVEAAERVLPMINLFREDKAQPGLARELVFANAPEEEDGAFKVPRIL